MRRQRSGGLRAQRRRGAPGLAGAEPGAAAAAAGTAPALDGTVRPSWRSNKVTLVAPSHPAPFVFFSLLVFSGGGPWNLLRF